MSVVHEQVALHFQGLLSACNVAFQSTSMLTASNDLRKVIRSVSANVVMQVASKLVEPIVALAPSDPAGLTALIDCYNLPEHGQVLQQVSLALQTTQNLQALVRCYLNHVFAADHPQCPVIVGCCPALASICCSCSIRND